MSLKTVLAQMWIIVMYESCKIFFFSNFALKTALKDCDCSSAFTAEVMTKKSSILLLMNTVLVILGSKFCSLIDSYDLFIRIRAEMVSLFIERMLSVIRKLCLANDKFYAQHFLLLALHEKKSSTKDEDDGEEERRSR